MESSLLLGGLTILVVGLIIRVFKLSGLIAGYNTSSKEEKEKYNEEKLTKFVGNMLIFSSTILLVGGLLSTLENMPNYLVKITWMLFVSVILFMAVYTNIGHNFKK